MQFFHSRNFSEKKGPPMSFFGSVRQKSFERKSWYLLLAIKLFDNRKFLKNEGFLYEIFRYCEKINFRQNRDTPSHAFFFNPEVFSNKRVTLRIFSVLSDKKFSSGNRDIPFLSIKFFDERVFLKNEGFPYEIFRYCDKIIIWHNCDTPSYAIFLIQKLSETQASPY